MPFDFMPTTGRKVPVRSLDDERAAVFDLFDDYIDEIDPDDDEARIAALIADFDF